MMEISRPPESHFLRMGWEWMSLTRSLVLFMSTDIGLKGSSIALPQLGGVGEGIFPDSTLTLLSSHLEETGDGKNVHELGCAFSIKSCLQILCSS